VPEWLIHQDKRENIPFIFPDHVVILSPTSLPAKRVAETHTIRWQRAHLPTGDYLLPSHPRCIIIERKRDLAELVSNCLTNNGRRKFADECKRLRDECQHPVLFVEGTLAHLLRTARSVLSCDPWLVVDAYQRLCFEYGIETFHVPCNSAAQRREAGELAAHILINGALTWPQSNPPSTAPSTPLPR